MAREVNSSPAAATEAAEAEGWTLPIFITRENKYPVGIVLAIVAAVLYLTSNHFHLFPPRLLPMSWVDNAVPFIPQTVWIYTTEYLLFLVVYVVCKDIVNLNRYAYAFLAQQTLAVLIFVFWPTTYPRDQFPLPEDLDPLTHLVFSSLRATDTPANCCPSLHVSSVYLSSFMFLKEQRGKFPFFFLWASAIAVTTLTTKQHYLVDVATGFIMAVLCYWVFDSLVSYRQAKR